MKRIVFLLSLGILAFGALAQTTNAPRTQLEAIETRTNTLVVKGFTEIGTINCSAGSVLVAAKESSDAATRERAYGVSVVVRGREGRLDTSYVDYDELDSMIRAMGLMTSPPWSESALPQIEASYTSKDGLRVASVNTRSNAGMEAIVQSSHTCVASAPLSVQQLITFRTLIEQAKGKLDGIRPKAP
jgi:hypothetical protein